MYLKVVFGSFYIEEKVMMVSFQSGYIFIQTDKPIYNPGDTGGEDKSCTHKRTRNINFDYKQYDSVLDVHIYVSLFMSW